MFSFLNSYLLIFLFAGLLPIVVYFFFKKISGKVFFSSLRFINIVNLKNKNKIRLQQIILLILRILVIVFIVLAISRPAMKISGMKSNVHNKTAIAILLDNSYSMDYLLDTKSDLQHAKKIADDINLQISNEDQLFLLTRDVKWNESTNIKPDNKIFTKVLNSIDITPHPIRWDDAIKNAVEVLNESEIINKEIIIITDYQFEKIESKCKIPIVVIPTYSKKEKNNLFCEDVNFKQIINGVSVENKVEFKIKNNSNTDSDVLCKLIIDENTITQKIVNVEKGSFVFNYFDLDKLKNGFHSGYVELVNERLPYDDKTYFTFKVNNNPRIAVISPDSKIPNHIMAILKLFTQKDEDIFVFSSNEWSNNKIDAIIILPFEKYNRSFDFYINKIKSSDVSTIFFAGKSISNEYKKFLESYFDISLKNFLESKSEINFKKNYDETITHLEKLSNVEINNFWSFVANKQKNVILNSKESPLLIEKDKSYFWSLDVNSMNNGFWVSPAFPTIMFKLLYPENKQQKLKYTVGKRIPTFGNKVFFNTKNKIIYTNSLFFIPENPGIYSFMDKNNKIVKQFPVNLDFNEGNYKPFDKKPKLWKIVEKKDISDVFINSLGFDLWKYFLWFALICLVIEMIYVRILQRRMK